MPDKPHVVLSVESEFPLGELSITPGARDALSERDIETALNKHASGNWGELEREDIEANEDSLKRGGRLLSVYHSGIGGRFYIITEADRSHTTILLPFEY
jgi:hypothetical protein